MANGTKSLDRHDHIPLLRLNGRCVSHLGTRRSIKTKLIPLLNRHAAARSKDPSAFSSCEPAFGFDFPPCRGVTCCRYAWCDAHYLAHAHARRGHDAVRDQLRHDRVRTKRHTLPCPECALSEWSPILRYYIRWYESVCPALPRKGVVGMGVVGMVTHLALSYSTPPRGADSGWAPVWCFSSKTPPRDCGHVLRRSMRC